MLCYRRYLGDPMLFKLMRLPDATPGTPATALPMAAACFNTLKCAAARDLLSRHGPSQRKLCVSCVPD